jgi:hypothetical protein
MVEKLDASRIAYSVARCLSLDGFQRLTLARLKDWGFLGDLSEVENLLGVRLPSLQSSVRFKKFNCY